jgi:hypothetical protein
MSLPASLDPNALLPLAPIGISFLVLVYAIVRMRRPMALSVIPILLGPVGPIAGVAIYLFVTKPQFNVITAVAVVVVTLVLAAQLGRRPKTWLTATGPAIKRPLLVLALWAVAYLLALALPVLVVTTEGRAAGALLMLGSAGLATGASLGLLMRRIGWARGNRPA